MEYYHISAEDLGQGARVPLVCAVPVESDLASLERVGLDDLHGHALMLIQRGWNEDIDSLRDEVRREHPQIEVRDFEQYKAEVFNECASSGAALASLQMWESVHPLLRTLPTTWDCSVTYGLMYAPDPSDHVAALLDAVRAELGAEMV